MVISDSDFQTHKPSTLSTLNGSPKSHADAFITCMFDMVALPPCLVADASARVNKIH